MDGLIEAAKLLTEHPILAALLEILTLAFLVWLWRDMMASRERYGERMETHEKECAERWGYVKAKLDEIDRRTCT